MTFGDDWEESSKDLYFDNLPSIETYDIETIDGEKLHIHCDEDVVKIGEYEFDKQEFQQMIDWMESVE